MKTKTQKAGRTPQSPQVANTNGRADGDGMHTWEVKLFPSLARQLEHLTQPEREALVRSGIMHMTHNQSETQRNDQLKVEFDRAVEEIDCTFNTGFGGRSSASVAIGRNRANECWEIVQCQYSVQKRTVSLPEALREMARLHILAEDGFVTSHFMDHGALNALFSEAADTIEYAGQMLAK